MEFKFSEDGEPLFLRKVPLRNIIEAKIGGKVLLYERTAEGPKKANDLTDSKEPIILGLIEQYFMGQKQNRHKAK